MKQKLINIATICLFYLILVGGVLLLNVRFKNLNIISNNQYEYLNK